VETLRRRAVDEGRREGLQEVLHVPCIAGTPSTFGDDAARSFASGLYGALGYGESIATAFRQGRAAICLEGHERPEAGQPQPAVRDGAGAIVLAADQTRTALLDISCRVLLNRLDQYGIPRPRK